MSTIAAIVPTFNRLALFKRSVDSVFAQTIAPDHFLILNNHCTDGTREYLDTLNAKTHGKTTLHVFHEDENLGASLGMRLLFEQALRLKPDWIWVMDDDGWAYPDALEQIMTTAEFNDPATYILESKIVDASGDWPTANRPSRFNEKSFDFSSLSDEEALTSKPISVHTGGYCGLLIRREAFEEFGFPNSDFHLWYDDVDFVMRVSRKKKVFLVPQSKIRHDAQALVEHVRKWPFNGPLPKIPEHLLPRYYYLQRNWLWMAKSWMPRHRFVFFWSKHMLRNLATPLLLKQDRLGKRWLLTLRAGFDALLGKLGRKF